MPVQEKVKIARKAIHSQLQDLARIMGEVRENGNCEAGVERLSRWKNRTGRLLRETVHPDEADRFQAKRAKIALGMGNPADDLVCEVKAFAAFLRALDQELAEHPGDVLDVPPQVEEMQVPAARLLPSNSESVFVVHGHDESNLRRLEDLIRDKWKLNPIVLSSEPGKGRTIIEKFEDEAQRASFAFVLLTPDDVIETISGTYAQERPNVVFELGWFFGKLGRTRVCILSKEGTHIHSDLDGILRVQFHRSVHEVVGELERELLEAEVLKKVE